MAQVIAKLGKPALILAHNKTLAAQLYAEMKELFPKNRVEYFVSYYDYYQPESYLPSSDTYIEKDAQVNPQIERMRLQATASLFSRKDVIIVASVSCIYGLGNPDDYWNLSVDLKKGETKSRDDVLRGLVGMQYARNDDVLEPGKFRVRGDIIDVAPSYDNERIIRIELFGDEIERILELDRLNLTVINELTDVTIFPAKHYVTPDEKIEAAVSAIEDELRDSLPNLQPLEAMRLEKRTKYDLELIKELGFCNGIENYSRHFDGRAPGEPPYTLIDYFPKDFLFIIDESHQTIPQLHAMYNGDRARKTNLVEHGFRLPCAYDNRPLKFEETEKKHFHNVIFVSATPSEYERKTSGQIVEMIIRPTGLLDPTVEVRPSKGQIQDVMKEVATAVANGWRVLVTTLTKKMAEDLTDYLGKEQIKVRYLHSDIDTLERTEIIRELRLGTFDVLVGINLLREGLDIPETALVCILDADKEGFLRNDTSLLQTIGRAARNAEGRVIFYADRMTDSMKRAIDVTHARRAAQEKYNTMHGITPATIVKPVREKQVDIKTTKHLPKGDIPNLLIELQAAMDKAAAELDFERAIEMRDRIKSLEKEYGVETPKADD
jgi:excinuclease ABC subunit B